MKTALYVIWCARNVLYVGITDNLPRRMWQHANRLGKGPTAKYKARHFTVVDYFSGPQEAQQAERALAADLRACLPHRKVFGGGLK